MEAIKKQKGRFGDRAEAQVTSNPEVSERAKLRGRFQAECFREGKKIWEEDVSNIITNEGLDAILNIMLHGATQITAWYTIIVETNTSPAAGLTYAVPSFTESQAYDEATRPAYTEAAASSQSITNSANKSVFTMNATKTIYGAALVGGGSAATTKGDAAGGGTLLCYALFGSSRAVVDNDVINLTYTLTAADDGV